MSTSSEFDIRILGEIYEKGSIRPRRRMVLLFGIPFGAFVCVIGIFFFIVGTPHAVAGTFQDHFYLVFVVLGAGIVGEGVWVLRTFPTAAIRLTVGSDGIELVRPDRDTVRVAWRDFPQRISMSDWRGVPTSRKRSALRDLEFELNARTGVQTAIPVEAVRSLVLGATTHGLTAVGWVESPACPGRTRRITFASRGEK